MQKGRQTVYVSFFVLLHQIKLASIEIYLLMGGVLERLFPFSTRL